MDVVVPDGWDCSCQVAIMRILLFFDCKLVPAGRSEIGEGHCSVRQMPSILDYPDTTLQRGSFI